MYIEKELIEHLLDIQVVLHNAPQLFKLSEDSEPIELCVVEVYLGRDDYELVRRYVCDTMFFVNDGTKIAAIDKVILRDLKPAGALLFQKICASANMHYAGPEANNRVRQLGDTKSIPVAFKVFPFPE